MEDDGRVTFVTLALYALQGYSARWTNKGEGLHVPEARHRSALKILCLLVEQKVVKHSHRAMILPRSARHLSIHGQLLLFLKQVQGNVD